MTTRWKVSALGLAIALAITGCKEEDVTKQLRNMLVQTPADYATRSNEDYNQNKYGLIGAETAAKLITDWETNKPKGKRNLYIMQFGNVYGFDGNHTEMTAAGEITLPNGYLKSNPEKGVYVFDRTAGCSDEGDSRFDGVTAMPKPVFTIQEMDAAFQYYGIDPDQDVIMLVLASDSPTSAGDYMAGVARMWYTLTYWGFPQESIMLLNGQASHVLNPDVNSAIKAMGITRDSIFTALPSNPPANPKWKSISKVKVDGTILQATMKDMMNVIDLNSSENLILDARSSSEYKGDLKKSKTESKTCGVNKNEQCYTAFEGHMKGAGNINFTDVLNTKDWTIDINNDGKYDRFDATMTFKPLATLDALFVAQGYKAGQTVHTYCRTGTKASLLTFTSAAVLGYKTRMYDGSWIQWGKLANKLDTNGVELVPAGNKWLTDAYSVVGNYNTAANTGPLQAGSNFSANDTNLIIYTDKSAKYPQLAK